MSSVENCGYSYRQPQENTPKIHLTLFSESEDSLLASSFSSPQRLGHWYVGLSSLMFFVLKQCSLVTDKTANKKKKKRESCYSLYPDDFRKNWSVVETAIDRFDFEHQMYLGNFHFVKKDSTDLTFIDDRRMATISPISCSNRAYQVLVKGFILIVLHNTCVT